MAAESLEQLVSLAKRRGFIYPSNELYGGLASVYDLGPLGVALKQNLKKLWWQRFVESRDNIVGLESAILTRREVLQASGHEAEFTDPLVECKKCHERYRSDVEISKAKDHEHEFTEPKPFNLMFKTFAGPVEDSAALVYLRPETAQGMFTNFKNITETMRVKVPFGIAQVGKSFRNEITTGTFLFRLREFEIAEIEFFVKPGTDDEWFTKWVGEWEQFLCDLGLAKERLHRYEHPKESLAHYSKGTTDVEYQFPFGWGEVTGVANRTDFDLKQHQEFSKKDLQYFDEETKSKYLPYVIEPTLGVERVLLAVLCEAFQLYPAGRKQKTENREQNEAKETQEAAEAEVVLHLHPKLAPVTVAVLPLVKKEGMPEKAREIVGQLRQVGLAVVYDESATIGRRYRRQDEIGTPWCVTVDGETVAKGTVTVRDRDSMEQERIANKELSGYIQSKLG